MLFAFNYESNKSVFSFKHANLDIMVKTVVNLVLESRSVRSVNQHVIATNPKHATGSLDAFVLLLVIQGTNAGQVT